MADARPRQGPDPGLPRPNPVRSYWWEPLSDIADWRTTAELPSSADVVIVGGGISGASIAYNLLTERPDTKIVLLEARQAASGASGRNGGHTKPASYRTFLDNVTKVGTQEAVKIARLEYNCMKAVHEFIASHKDKIDADAIRCDTTDIFYDEEAFSTAKESVNLLRKSMGTTDPAADYEIFGADEAASKYLCPGGEGNGNALGGIKYPAGSLNGYKLTIGILKLGLERGLNLQCNTPVLRIDSGKRPDAASNEEEEAEWTVSTERGKITTPTLILATNGYTGHLLPELRNAIRPFRGVVTAQRPGQNLPQTGLPTTYSMVYQAKHHGGYEYMISRQAGMDFSGDLVIGGGRYKAGRDENEVDTTDDTVVPPTIQSYLVDCTAKYFGPENWGQDHPEGRLRMVWSGIMSQSADGYPFVGGVPGKSGKGRGLFLSVSFQGHGMVLCFLSARACTEMILGRDQKQAGSAPAPGSGSGSGSGLDEWFPNSFRVTLERMTKGFQ